MNMGRPGAHLLRAAPSLKSSSRRVCSHLPSSCSRLDVSGGGILKGGELCALPSSSEPPLSALLPSTSWASKKSTRLPGRDPAIPATGLWAERLLRPPGVLGQAEQIVGGNAEVVGKKYQPLQRGCFLSAFHIADLRTRDLQELSKISLGYSAFRSESTNSLPKSFFVQHRKIPLTIKLKANIIKLSLKLKNLFYHKHYYII